MDDDTIAHTDCYTVADLRDICLALAGDLDHLAHNAANNAGRATSAVTRFQNIGKSNAYREAARIARLAAPRVE